jgi:nucleotide-binding universal stress UspA family protein
MTSGLFRQVLVGWDGSADAAEALRTAVAIASPSGHVVALSILQQQVRMEPHDELDPGPERLQLRAETIFEQLRRQDACAAEVHTSTQMIAGDAGRAGQALCSYALEHRFDLIVMGRRGDSIRPGHLGRSAKAAAQSSTVPVLLLSAS